MSLRKLVTTPFVTNYQHDCSGNEIYNSSSVCFTLPILQPAHMLGIAMPQTAPHWPFPPTQYQQPFSPIHHTTLIAHPVKEPPPPLHRGIGHPCTHIEHQNCNLRRLLTGHPSDLLPPLRCDEVWQLEHERLCKQ